MNEYELKDLIAQNLIHYRKLNNLTQLQLAEKINYSDKSISKWERGESFPDLLVLIKITELFGITLNDLINVRKVKVKHKESKSRTLITLIAFATCWLIATSVYVLLGIFLPNFTKAWLSFIYSIPVSMIVLIVFSKLWGKIIFTFISTTVLIWSIPLSILLSINYENLWLLFLCIIPLQLIMSLWFILKKDLMKQRSITKDYKHTLKIDNE